MCRLPRTTTVLVAIAAMLAVAACNTEGEPVPHAGAGVIVQNNSSTTPVGPVRPLTVNLTGIDGLINTESVQKWARDVQRGDEATLVAKCWTFPAGYIRDRYLGQGNRLVDAMATPPGGAQSGVIWQAASGDEVLVTWAEGRSDYACPKVYPHDQPAVDQEYVAHRVKRFILREQGRPLTASDTDTNYPLVCELRPGVTRNVGRADPENIVVTTVGEDEWRAVAGPVTFEIGYEPAEPCVRSSS